MLRSGIIAEVESELYIFTEAISKEMHAVKMLSETNCYKAIFHLQNKKGLWKMVSCISFH